MLLHIALVAEILATIICFHCIYGKKLKWDVKTVAAVLSVLTVLEMVNYYHLSGIFSFLVYVILFIYCKYEFKSKFAETVISFVLCMILISSISYLMPCQKICTGHSASW